jgi:hypothetical protein
VAWKKGLKDHEAVLQYIESHKIPFPLVIHFRTASVGGPLPELTHPFPVEENVSLDLEGDTDMVLFHNGHVADWEKWLLQANLGSPYVLPAGGWSDTRALAWLTWLKSESIIPFVSGSSRVCIFSSTPYLPEGEKYDVSVDHFNFFGSWVKGEGWKQSIATVTQARNRVWNHLVDEYDALPSPAQRVSNSNVWTVEELAELLAQIEKEQADARTALGL